MKIRIFAAAIAATGVIILSGPSFAQQKTAKDCTAEWRASKSANQAAKITEKSYVAKCRADTASAPAATPAKPQSSKRVRPATTAATTAAPERTTATPAPTREVPASPPPTRTAAPAAPVQPTRPTAPARQSSTPQPASLGPGQYASEAQAKLYCLTDAVVWTNLDSKIYHLSGHRNYGTTKTGAYMCQKTADASGARPSKN